MFRNDPEIRRAVLVIIIIYAICVGWVLLIAFAKFAMAEPPLGDGIPLPSKTKFFTVNLCYTNDSGEPVCEKATLPELEGDFGRVGGIFASPIDARRMLETLPTYALARFHWWVFGADILPRAQRQYADCVGRIRAYQELLKISPLIDGPSSPLLPVVEAVREYRVPMDPIQRENGLADGPPTREDAVRHAIAAADTVNVTSANTALCEVMAHFFKKKVQRRMR